MGRLVMFKESRFDIELRLVTPFKYMYAENGLDRTNYQQDLKTNSVNYFQLAFVH